MRRKSDTPSLTSSASGHGASDVSSDIGRVSLARRPSGITASLLDCSSERCRPYFIVSDKVLTQTWFKVCLEFRLLRSSEQQILCLVTFLILDLQCPPQYSYRPHQMTNCPLPLADSPSVNDFLIFIIMICSRSLLCDNIHWLGSYPQYSIYYLHMVEKVLLNLLINLLWWNEMHPASG